MFLNFWLSPDKTLPVLATSLFFFFSLTFNRNALINVQQHFKKLYEDYQQLLQQTELNQTAEGSYREKSQQMNYIETVDALNNQLVTKNELLLRKESEIEQLSKRICELELECENVAILKAQVSIHSRQGKAVLSLQNFVKYVNPVFIHQVEVYQSDFNAERQAREALVAEKEKIAEELRLLHRRNKDLIEELSTFRTTSNVACTKAEPVGTEVCDSYNTACV